MAVYNAVVTNAGRTLFSQAAVGGGQVLPVRITTGDGTLGATDPTTLTSLIHRVQDYSISSSNSLVPYQSTYQFLIDSSQVTATYQLREVGLIAKIGASGPETLIWYSYVPSNQTPDTISPSSGYNATIDFNTLTIAFSNTPNTSATLTAAVPPALHAITHLHRTDGTSTDPIPTATTGDVGLVPNTPNDPSKVLIGTATASWGTAPRIVGEIIDFAGATPPAGWLICDGSSYPTASYPALFNVIGYLYGGSGTAFNLPDCRGRVSLGAGAAPGLTNRPLGSRLGEETHTLTVAEMPVHNHVVNDPGHNHVLSDPTHSHGITQSPHAHSIYDPTHQHPLNSTQVGIQFTPGPDQCVRIWPYPTDATYYAATGISIYASNANVTINAAATGIGISPAATGISTANTGSGSPHNVMQPSIVFNKLIKY